MAGSARKLTATEYPLLQVLSLHAGRVVPYDMLLRHVWSGREHAGPNLARIVVRNLRRKLGEDAARPAWIFNQRGAGCRTPNPGER